jgi:surface polysaccharide O-acyltransferase-like enzyme
MQIPPAIDSRIHYIDNIRSIIIVFVVLFHAILPYVVTPWWYVTDPPPIPVSFFFIILMDATMMPILFFIAGLLARPSYKRKGARLFMAGKLKRLMFPFLLCTVFFSPIMPFIRQSLRATDSGVDPAGFWPFWISYITSGTTIHSSPVSVSTDLIVNQYWFLMLLFIFFVGFCLYNWMWEKNQRNQTERIAGEPRSRIAWLGSITIFCLMIGLLYALSSLFIGSTVWVTLGSLWQVQPAKIPIYLGFFLAGIFIQRRDLMSEILGIARPLTWFGAVVLLTAAYFTSVLKTMSAQEVSLSLVITAQILRICLLVSVLLWLLTLFHNRVNKATTLWRELSANSYNIYLIHMVVAVVFQMMVMILPVPSFLKFCIVSILTLLVSYLVGRFLVNRSSIATIFAVIIAFVFMSLTFR